LLQLRNGKPLLEELKPLCKVFNDNNHIECKAFF